MHFTIFKYQTIEVSSQFLLLFAPDIEMLPKITSFLIQDPWIITSIANLITIEVNIFVVIAWVAEFGIVYSISWYTIKSFSFLVATVTGLASMSFITLTMSIKTSTSICMIIAGVVVGFHNFAHRFFSSVYKLISMKR